MGEQLDLGKFLDQRRADGIQDSEGGFTVSHQNAARKLARFALPRTYAWVTKFVQAAVAWGCSELRIQQTRKVTQFQFLTERLGTLPTEQELVNVMLSGKVGGDQPIENLCVGLRALVEQANLSFLLVVDDGEIEPRPVYAGHFFGNTSEAERLSRKYRPGPGVTVNVAHIPSTETEAIFLVAGRYQLKILQELEEYCFLSPVPISVDGRRLDGLLRCARYCTGDRYRPLLVAGCRRDGSEDMPLPVDFEEKTLSVFTHPLKALRQNGGSRKFTAVCLVGLRLPRILEVDYPPSRRRSELHWVRQGVVVESVTLAPQTHAMDCDVFLNGEGLQTDLTGFRLVNSAQKAARETEMVQALAARIRESKIVETGFLPDRDAKSAAEDAYDEKQAVRKRVKILLKGAAGGLFLTLLNPPIGVPATIAGVLNAYVPRKDKVANKIKHNAELYRKILAKDKNTLVEVLSTWTCLSGESPRHEPVHRPSLELEIDARQNLNLNLDLDADLDLDYLDQVLQERKIAKSKQEPSRPRKQLFRPKRET